MASWAGEGLALQGAGQCVPLIFLKCLMIDWFRISGGAGSHVTHNSNSIMISKFSLSLLASIAVSSLLAGCHLPQRHTDMPSFGSLAQITAISPDTIVVLRPGEQVKLKVDVNYVLTADSGTIKLVVLAADSSELAQDVKAITKGRGHSTLQAEFTVPGTTVIRVFTPLVVDGRTSTSVADGRAFTVVPN